MSKESAIAPGATLVAACPLASSAHRDQKQSYREILKSSALIGGSSLVSIAVGIVRTKAMAVLLGPSGYGLMGAFGLIVDLARSVAQMGVNASGVRQIAEASGSGDLQRLSRTAAVVRGTALVSAVLGAVGLGLLAPYVSEVTFGTAQHADEIRLLSAAVFFGLIAGGQLALVQGLRRIADLSKIGIFGAVFGTIASIVIVYIMGERGIVLSLIAGALLSVGTGWWYRRKISLPAASLTLPQALSETSSLLKLGVAFMASGLLMLGASYVVRILVLRHSGLEAAGLYQAAWTVGGLYVGFVLQAMGADFYPRLVASVGDHDECNRLVNEQAKVSLLLAAPGVIATLAVSPLVVAVLYSASFAGSVETLRWICLGMALRVITWPIGYIIVAKNRQALFFVTDFAWAAVNVALSWYFVNRFGAVGAGIAFFASYVFHALLVYPIVRRLTGFRWSAGNLKYGFLFVVGVGGVFIGSEIFPPVPATAIGVGASVASALFAARVLMRLTTPGALPRPLLRLIELVGFTR